MIAAGLNESDLHRGRLYTSGDFGQHWVLTSAPDTNWFCVASSADGTHLIAGASSGGIYTSIDSGLNWVANDLPAQTWFAVSSSADGKNLAALPGGESAAPVYLSNNGGATWSHAGTIEGRWTGATFSSDGAKLTAVEGGYEPGLIYTFRAQDPSPALSIRCSGGDIIVSWPVTASDYSLEQFSSQNQAWTTVMSPVTVEGNRNQVLFSKAIGSGMFRLRSN